MIEKKAEAFLPTRFGDFKLLVFSSAGNGNEYAVLVNGEVSGKEDVFVRVHSGCLTGDVFGSLRCDCFEQLVASIKTVQGNGEGVIIYDRSQEGRGMGLLFKIKSYELQEKGLDTVQAAHSLGFSEDLRTYEAAAGILKQLGVKSICLLTNNPDKIRQVQKNGIRVTKRIPVQATPNDYNKKYLETKKIKMGHMF